MSLSRFLLAFPALVALPLQDQQVVTENDVRLRRTATKQGATISVLPRGDTLTLVRPDTLRNNFLHVTTAEDDTGWVSISFAHRLRPPRPTPLADSIHTLSTATLAAACGVKCGVERWAVKTLTDLDADEVDLTPVSRTVHQLRQLEEPDEKPDEERLGEVERSAYEVRAVIIGWVREDDKDIHLVIASESNHNTTIIAEVPSSSCRRVCLSDNRSEFDDARQVLVNRLGNPPSTFKSITPVRVRITGIGFFDQKHSNPQHGVAPNNFELHPVIRIVFP
jgi:hypothetical protein